MTDYCWTWSCDNTVPCHWGGLIVPMQQGKVLGGLIRILPSIVSICMDVYFIKHMVNLSLKAFGTHSASG